MKTTTYIYIIRKLWVDPSENEISASRGYEIVGAVLSEEEAERWVAAGGTMEPMQWPSIREGTPKFFYERVSLLEADMIQCAFNVPEGDRLDVSSGLITDFPDKTRAGDGLTRDDV